MNRNQALSIACIAAGALIIGHAFGSVPREERSLQWPLLGTAAAVPAAVVVARMRKGDWQLPGGSRSWWGLAA